LKRNARQSFYHQYWRDTNRGDSESSSKLPRLCPLSLFLILTQKGSRNDQVRSFQHDGRTWIGDLPKKARRRISVLPCKVKVHVLIRVQVFALHRVISVLPCKVKVHLLIRVQVLTLGHQVIGVDNKHIRRPPMIRSLSFTFPLFPHSRISQKLWYDSICGRFCRRLFRSSYRSIALRPDVSPC
jgi:hypothetical protein